MRWSMQGDTALLQAIDVARSLESLHDVLFDNDQRQAICNDVWQLRVNIAHDNGREAETDFIAQQQTRVRHECAPDCRHLLLSARQGRRGEMPAFGQYREQLVDTA